LPAAGSAGWRRPSRFTRSAYRAIYDLGITEGELDEVGVPAKEWALVGLNGNDVYSETRGRLAGYRWPQYAVHRGHLQMLLYRKVVPLEPASAAPTTPVTDFAKLRRSIC
jgi:hypothetical protein